MSCFSKPIVELRFNRVQHYDVAAKDIPGWDMELLERRSSGSSDFSSPWGDQLDKTIQDILERKPFAYDPIGDKLFSQYKDTYTRNGKLAMEDTMGKAATLTGGYGNSYAQQMGQQTYQGYMDKLNSVIPELHQLALDKYNAETGALYDRADLLAGLEDQDYDRWLTEQKWQQYGTPLGGAAQSPSSGTPGYTSGAGKKNWDNGEVDPENIKKMQEHIGVTADGKWGKNSSAATDGMTADEAWAAYQNGMLGNGGTLGTGTLERTRTDRTDYFIDKYYVSPNIPIGAQNAHNKRIAGDTIEAKIKEKQAEMEAAKSTQESYRLASVNDPTSEYYDPAFLAYTGTNGSQFALESDNPLAEMLEMDFMTDQEKAIFNYHVNVNGVETAMKYYGYLKENLRYRHGKDIADSASKWGPLGEVAYMGYAGLDNWAQGAQSSWDALTGNGGKKLPSASQYASGMIRENLGERGKLWQVAGDVTQSLGNMAPSLLMASVNPVAGYATTLVGAGGNAYQEARNLGYSDGEAKFYGTLSGASEVLMEKLLNGVGNFGGQLSGHAMEKLASKIHNANLRVAAKVGGKMGSEFTEEYLQEILTPVYQNIALGTDNDFELFTEEALYSGFLGAISSATFQGADYVSNKVFNRNTPHANNVQQPVDDLPTNISASRITQGSVENETDPLMELAKQVAQRQEAQQTAEIPVGETATVREDNPVKAATTAREAALTEEDTADADVIKAYRAYYDAGYSNTPREKVAVSSTALTEEQKAAAWEDGQKVRNSFEKGKTTSFVKQGETGAVVENPAALDFGKHNGKILKSLKQFAKNWGVKIVIGNYGDHINGSIKDGVIRLNAEKFTGKTKTQVLAKILAHEITHRMQETAPEAYAKYRDAALQHEASLVGGSLDGVIRGYQNRQVTAREKAVADARAKNKDITPEQIAAIEADYPDLSREDAMDEIAADYTKKFVADTEAFREFIGKSKEHRSLGRKLIDCAKAIVAKIKATFSSQKARDAASQEAFGKDLAAAEKALKLWEEAYAEGQKAVKNAPVQESTGEGVERYMLSDVAVPTREELEKKQPIKVIDISSPQTDGTFSERRKQILSNAKEVIKKPYLNSDTNTLIFLTEKSYTHAFNNIGELQLNAAEHLPEFIENAVLTHAEAPTHGDMNVDGVYTFFAAAKTSSVVPVKLKVKEYRITNNDIPKNIKEYFDGLPQGYASSYDTVVLEVDEIEKSPNGSAMHTTYNKPSHSPSELSTIKIADLLSLVKGKAKKYIPAPTNATDIRYSLSGDDLLAEAEEQAAAERETLDRLEYLRKQVAVTKKTTADPKAVDKLAKDTIRSWGADMETEDIAGDLQLAMDAALRMDAKTDVETVYNQFVDIGRKIAENIVEVDGDIYREYSELRKELRDYHIYVGPEIVADIADYFDTVRPYRNRLKLTTKKADGAVTIDQAFHDLQDAYPEFFNEDNVPTGSDQLLKLLEVTDTIYENGVSRLLEAQELENAAAWIANDILDSSFQLDSFKSLADVKAENRQAKHGAETPQGRIVLYPHPFEGVDPLSLSLYATINEEIQSGAMSQMVRGLSSDESNSRFN